MNLLDIFRNFLKFVEASLGHINEKCPYVKEKFDFGLKTFDKSTVVIGKNEQTSKCETISQETGTVIL